MSYIPAIVVRKQSEHLGLFRAAGAISPANARTLDELHCRGSLMRRRLVSRSVVADCRNEKSYLDEIVAAKYIGLKRRIPFAVVAVVIIVAILISFYSGSAAYPTTVRVLVVQPIAREAL